MISLITATLGRTEPIKFLLESLSRQTYKDFELLIIDQNQHYKVREIINTHGAGLKIKYIRNSQKGLSLNRNIGLNHSKGEIIGFPDDDCYYAPNVLENIVNAFNKNIDISFCATNWYDSIIKGQPARCFIEDTITKKDVYKKCISFNVFIRHKWNIRFDEKLGVGAQFGAGEETDYLYSLITESGLNGYFISSGGVFHPVETNRNATKIYNYAVGQGAVWKKDLIFRNNWRSIIDGITTSIRYLLSGLKHRNFTLARITISGFYKGFCNYHLDK